ncbi:hypothetical protein GXW82_06175 [Streptacidiphilus sp. 4-A2]|nr:hypothetical protein [Streptacidiphilus sp. 4-A2]
MSDASVLNDLGVPWPDADTGKARQAAAAWSALAEAIGTALGTAGGAARVLSVNNTGPAMDAFNTYWGGIGGPSEACQVVQKPALLPVLMQVCTALSTACAKFADAVDDAKAELGETVLEIEAALAAAVLATAFTAGASDAADALIGASFVGEAMNTIEVLGTTVGEIVSSLTPATMFGTMDAALETEFSNGIKAATGQPPDSVKEILAGLAKGFGVGLLTGGVATAATGAITAGTTAASYLAMDHLESVLEIVPDLPLILQQIPDALETPAGDALRALESEYASRHLINRAEGRPTDPPSVPEVIGELIDAKIEGSSEGPEGGGGSSKEDGNASAKAPEGAESEPVLGPPDE